MLSIQSFSTDIKNFKEDEICCICMENKPNLILSCTHSYCETCIKEWQVTSLSCPVCRCYSGKDDCFILADYNFDYYNLQVYILSL